VWVVQQSRSQRSINKMGNQAFSDALLGPCCSPVERKDGSPFGVCCGADDELRLAQERLELAEAAAESRKQSKQNHAAARSRSHQKKKFTQKRTTHFLRSTARSASQVAADPDPVVDPRGVLPYAAATGDTMMTRMGVRLHLFLLFCLLMLWKYTEENILLTLFFLAIGIAGFGVYDSLLVLRQKFVRKVRDEGKKGLLDQVAQVARLKRSKTSAYVQSRTTEELAADRAKGTPDGKEPARRTSTVRLGPQSPAVEEASKLLRLPSRSPLLSSPDGPPRGSANAQPAATPKKAAVNLPPTRTGSALIRRRSQGETGASPEATFHSPSMSPLEPGGAVRASAASRFPPQEAVKHAHFGPQFSFGSSSSTSSDSLARPVVSPTQRWSSAALLEIDTETPSGSDAEGAGRVPRLLRGGVRSSSPSALVEQNLNERLERMPFLRKHSFLVRRAGGAGANQTTPSSQTSTPPVSVVGGSGIFLTPGLAEGAAGSAAAADAEPSLWGVLWNAAFGGTSNDVVVTGDGAAAASAKERSSSAGVDMKRRGFAKRRKSSNSSTLSLQDMAILSRETSRNLEEHGGLGLDEKPGDHVLARPGGYSSPSYDSPRDQSSSSSGSSSSDANLIPEDTVFDSDKALAARNAILSLGEEDREEDTTSATSSSSSTDGADDDDQKSVDADGAPRPPTKAARLQKRTPDQALPSPISSSRSLATTATAGTSRHAPLDVIIIMKNYDWSLRYELNFDPVTKTLNLDAPLTYKWFWCKERVFNKVLVKPDYDLPPGACDYEKHPDCVIAKHPTGVLDMNKFGQPTETFAYTSDLLDDGCALQIRLKILKDKEVVFLVPIRPKRGGKGGRGSKIGKMFTEADYASGRVNPSVLYLEREKIAFPERRITHVWVDLDWYFGLPNVLSIKIGFWCGDEEVWNSQMRKL